MIGSTSVRNCRYFSGVSAMSFLRSFPVSGLFETRSGGGASTAPRLEQAAHGERAQEAHGRDAGEVPAVSYGRGTDHHGRRTRHAAQARRGLSARALPRRLLEAPLARAGRDAHRVQGHLRNASPAGQRALPEHEYGPGPHLSRERAAGRHQEDRLSGHLLADSDLVLRAARVASPLEGPTAILPAVRRGRLQDAVSYTHL